MYKVNLHILYSCNYDCKYCFRPGNRQRHLKFDSWKRIIDNCLKSGIIDSFNIAGGEPLLSPYIGDMVDYIKSQGAECSIITNGVFLDRLFISTYAPKLNGIGVSCDSFDNDINIKLGACTKWNEILTKDKLYENISYMKQYAPECKIKLNTVVTTLNYNDTSLKNLKQIDRWKILKMRNTGINSFLVPTDVEFKHFVNQVAIPDYTGGTLKKDNIIIEDNLSNSYLIVDPQGYLTDTEGIEYKRVQDLQKEVLDINKVTLDTTLYNKRYGG